MKSRMARRCAGSVRTARLRLSALAGQQRGGALLEFAVALPVLAMLLFGIFEFGRVLWIENALHYSVQQAARCASINLNTCGNGSVATTSAVRNYAVGLAGAGIPSSVFTVTLSTSCGGVTGSKVSASYALPTYIPLFSFNPTLSAASCFPN